MRMSSMHTEQVSDTRYEVIGTVSTAPRPGRDSALSQESVSRDSLNFPIERSNKKADILQRSALSRWQAAPPLPCPISFSFSVLIHRGQAARLGG